MKQPRFIDVRLVKADDEAEWWPRLTKVKDARVQIDWSRWKDEDDDDGDDQPFDLGSMGLE